ncbi:PadR family transcriptional regulator [Leucobacter allii]|uniref:PadR family transcriptional regulator n=1 Tax=Leucobacter allii TaxID=2932247 RepID=A0ABY4FNL3_9MICO|nr:PadR family transcriptional regulator [Leucobacter allii]UOQ57883.1 PadR family transcriptional regulator [Leucobacter allii]
MAQPLPGRSPLAMIVLTLLEEAPMHAYRMQQLIRMREKDAVVNVASRNSIHQVLSRLERDGLVVAEPDDSARTRVVYRNTPAGREVLLGWLAETLARPRNEYPSFAAALSCLPLTTPDVLASLLRERLTALDALVAAVQPERTREAHGLARVFVIEDEYRRAMLAAERAWVAATVEELEDGRLSWAHPASDSY